ncbi:hypothetical protein BGY98DRAFT_976812 [Russula aff. rugulosa BPL654]|nr:hypothetical protein BGY98DRAFT_976812 [Russula aff. rugulosa BPL654]
MVFLLLSNRPFLRCYATRAGDSTDTKGEVVSEHPANYPDEESGSREGDHDSTAYATFPPPPFIVISAATEASRFCLNIAPNTGRLIILAGRLTNPPTVDPSPLGDDRHRCSSVAETELIPRSIVSL